MGYTPPTRSEDGRIVSVPKEEWTDREWDEFNYNAKALNALYCAISLDEFKRVSTCTTAKEVWDIFEVTHEGTSAVKLSKLQRLTTEFERMTMEDNEKFKDFHARLSDVVNNSYNLGEKIPESKVVHKILRSLPDSFLSKVTAIEESKDVDAMKLEELVGSLETFELNLKPSKKTNGIALTSVKEAIAGSDDDSEVDDEEVALFVKKYRNYRRKFRESTSNQGGKWVDRSRTNQNKNDKKGGRRPDKQVQSMECFNCHRPGHIAADCP